MRTRPPLAPDAVLDRPSNLRPLVAVCGVLVLAILGMVLWPQAKPPEMVQSVPASSPVVASQVYELPADVPVSQLLTQPLRVADRNHVMPRISAVVGSVLGDTALARMLVQALQERRSNAYVDALLNGAAERGDISVPNRLLRADGGIDTTKLLSLLLTEAGLSNKVTLAPAGG